MEGNGGTLDDHRITTLDHPLSPVIAPASPIVSMFPDRPCRPRVRRVDHEIRLAPARLIQRARESGD
jgi:hypothetical protein